MFTKRIWNIAKKNPYIARMVEISFYGAVLWLLTYAWEGLQTWDFSNWKLAVWMLVSTFCAWIISGIKKVIREKMEPKK